MRRQHVIIGGNDADIHRPASADHRLVLATRREAMRQIATGQLRAVGPGVAATLDQVQILAAAWRAPLHDAFGDLGDHRMKVSHASWLRLVQSGQWPKTAPSSPKHRVKASLPLLSSRR